MHDPQRSRAALHIKCSSSDQAYRFKTYDSFRGSKPHLVHPFLTTPTRMPSQEVCKFFVPSQAADPPGRALLSSSDQTLLRSTSSYQIVTKSVALILTKASKDHKFFHHTRPKTMGTDFILTRVRFPLSSLSSAFAGQALRQ